MIKINKKSSILILGYGEEGKSVFAFFEKKVKGISIVEEKRMSSEDLKSLTKKNITVLQSFDEKIASEADIIFKSPGFKNYPALKRFVREGKLTSQAQYFFEHCNATIIGVTGTKGKTTTVSVLKNMLTSQVKSKVYLTGNIGLSDPLRILGKIKKTDFVIYELSSFQLEYMTVSPKVAVVLSVSSDHIDYHKFQKAYVDSKVNIVKFQKKGDVVISVDERVSKKIAAISKGREVLCGRSNLCDFCIDDKTIAYNDDVFDLSKLKLKGLHNKLNLACAIAAVYACVKKIDKAKITRAYNAFRPINYRLENVMTLNGVEYYNDSIATVPDATLAGVDALADRSTILLVGGRSKLVDYSSFLKQLSLRTSLKAVIVFGELASLDDLRVKDVLKCKLIFAPSGLDEAFRKANAMAESGDRVLLSPAATSFDEFENYKKRGERFNQLCQNLQK